eukprot:c11316_g1_i1 orf=459-1661(+)
MKFPSFCTLGCSMELDGKPRNAGVLTNATSFDGFLHPSDLQELLSCSWSTFNQDQSPLISKEGHGFLCFDDQNVTGGESCQSTPKRFEELKNWLWMKHQHPFVSRPGRWLHVKWLDRGLEHLRNFIRTPIKKWLRCRRKQRLCLHSEHVQAALSVARVAAALATVAAATAASAKDEIESRTGVAVASAAGLVAAHCADLAGQIGADHHAVLASVNSGGLVQNATDILELTVAAASSLQAVRHASNFQEQACIYAAISPYDVQMSPFSSISSCLTTNGTHGDCYHSHEILARGGDFLVRFDGGKLHWRSVCVFLDMYKQVILKLRSRHLAGAVSKSKKRIVSELLVNVQAWPGRSLLHNGEERYYFAVMTSHGTIEFECESDFDHQSWTEGISHLLCVAKQ